jgi:hypothetical protein
MFNQNNKETNCFLFIHTKQSFSCVMNKDLSWKAKGLYYYLITRPPQWKLNHIDLFCRSTDGEKGMLSGMYELINKKYIYRLRSKNKKIWGYFICEKPTKEEEIIEVIAKELPEYDLFKIKEKVNNDNPEMTPPKRSTPQTDYIYKDNKEDIKSYIEESKDSSLLEKSPLQVKDIDVRSGERQEAIKLKPLNKEEISNSLQKKNKLLSKKNKLIPLKHIPQSIQEILSLHGLVHKYRGEDTKAYISSVEAIKNLKRGLAFNNLDQFKKYHNRLFTCDEIKAVVQRMILAMSPDYYPKNKKFLSSISFADVVYHKFHQKSLFLEYFENPPKQYGNGVALIDDPNPRVTALFRNYWIKTKGVQNKLTVVEENKIRVASKKLIELLTKNRQQLSPIMIEDYVDCACEAIFKHVGESRSKLELGYFISERTWNTIIPSYFIDQGLLND